MHGILRAVAGLLLITMAAMPGAQAMPFPAAHPAGCHGGGPVPNFPSLPSPTNFQCCVNGHHWTLPSMSFSIRPLLAQFAASDGGEDLSLASTLSAHFSLNAVTASSPPGIAPLRI
jgi:hypothetical protein